MADERETIFASDEQVAQVLGQRSAMYGLLSRLYEREVDDGLLDQMCAMRMPRNTGNAEVDEAYRLLSGALSERWERTVEDLAIDYARTFLGDGMSGNAAAYPFESVHTSAERLMMQDARDEVLALYRSEGFEKADGWKDNEDHIALELAFEKVLCDAALAALEAGDRELCAAKLEAQRNFLNDHLLNWVPLLTGSMERFCRTDFYRAVSLLTYGYLHEDRGFLDDLLAPCGEERRDG